MKWGHLSAFAVTVSACAARQEPASAEAPAGVGIVNHTENFIYSATVNGSGSGNMDAWGP